MKRSTVLYCCGVGDAQKHATIFLGYEAVNGVVFYLDHASNFVALDANSGQVLWQFNAGNTDLTGIALPIIAGDIAYADFTQQGGADGVRYTVALDLHSGKELWRQPGGSPMKVHDKVVYSWSRTALTAFDATTGTVRWSYASDDTAGSSLTFDHDSIFVTGWSGSPWIYALSATTGKLTWKLSLPAGDQTYAIAGVAQGVLVLSNNTAGVTALDENTGKLKWPTLRSQGIIGFDPSGTMYVWSNMSLMAYDVVTGTQRWQTPVTAYGYSYLNIPSDSVLSINNVYTHILAYDIRTGAVRWNIHPGGYFDPRLHWSSAQTSVFVSGFANKTQAQSFFPPDGMFIGPFKLFALNPITGAVAWTQTLPHYIMEIFADTVA